MINILYSGNDKVFDGALTTTLSILNRTETTEPFNFYILTMDVSDIKPAYTPITDKKVEFLDKIVKEYNKENRVTKIDVTEIYNKEFRNSPNENCYCSPYTLLRLLIDLLPDMPDKILYLDIDIMLNRDITLLYNKDITNYEYASARDHYGKFFIHPNYINAGVLLFNLKRCKETKLFEKARNLIRTKKLMFADQSAIYRSTTKKLMLPQKFNDQKFLHKHTIIRHFSKRLFWTPYPHTENIKQWHIDKVHKRFGYTQFDDILEKYTKLKEKFQNIEKENSMTNNNISIFFSCDDNYIPFLVVSLSSIIENASKNYNYDIYVLHSNNISKENQEKIFKEYSKDNFNVNFVDITSKIESFSTKLHTRDYYSKSTYYRLFIPNLYPNLDKALYLDSDIVVLGDISKLFNTDLGNNYVGAIPDHAVSKVPEFISYVKNRIGVKSEKEYFNAGILLMNLKKLREINFEDLFITLLSKITFNVAQDQDYLNSICKGNVTFIDPSWNVMPIPNDLKEINLIHYNLSYKPWHADNILYEDIFWNQAKKTSYYDTIVNIKNNYSQEDVEKSNLQTVNLIRLAGEQAEDKEENERIKSIVNSIFSKN